jgi:DNA-binding NtrC family response regulator
MSTQNLNQDVLIVDDDPDMRDILDTALSGLGYNTFLAEDGDIALRLFNEHRPHLVVSDIFMPRFDGLRLMKEIKILSKETPVILISGYSHFENQTENINGEFQPDALLRKPFNLRDLIDTIRSFLGHHTNG